MRKLLCRYGHCCVLCEYIIPFSVFGLKVLFLLFKMFLVLAVVFGMVVYRVICMRLLARVGSLSHKLHVHPCISSFVQMDNPTVDSYAFLIVSVTAATINLVIIIAMNYVNFCYHISRVSRYSRLFYFQFYNSLAHRLTRWECPRTQADFDNSYTFKVFLFQFANYYSSLFYIAFFKGV